MGTLQPDLLVMGDDGEVFFVEVKYRPTEVINGSLKEWLTKAVNYWPEAKLLIVHPNEPYFLISTIRDYMRTERFYPLEKDKFLWVNKKIIASYAELVRKYLA